MIPGLFLNHSAHTMGRRNLQTTRPGPRAAWRPGRLFQCEAMTTPGGRGREEDFLSASGSCRSTSPEQGTPQIPAPGPRGASGIIRHTAPPSALRGPAVQGPHASYGGSDGVTCPSRSPQTRGRARQAASPAPVTSTSRLSPLPKERLATNRPYDYTARLSRPGSGHQGSRVLPYQWTVFTGWHR